MTSKLRGGKTPPRLLDDLSLYNPHRLRSGSFNVLTDVVQFDPSSVTTPKKSAKNVCQHRWALKQQQCLLQKLDARPDSSSQFIVAAICAECRCHLEMTVDYRGEGRSTVPCPKEDAPLHHFIYAPNESCGLSTNQEGVDAGSWTDTQIFQCSSLTCSARLIIHLRSPLLKPEWVTLLTDKHLIRTRAEKAIAEEPERFEGHAVPSVLEVIGNLRTYISNSMSSSDERHIPSNNKKWLLCFGEPLTDLLLYVGFARKDDVWIPPRPDISNTTPFTNTLNIRLNDVENELGVLVNQQPHNERHMFKAHVQLKSAKVEIERILGSISYKTVTSRTVDLTEDQNEHPFYAGLGSTLDFHDDLISFAYERQIACDTANSPYYLECLQGIANGRNSEDLQTKVAIEASSGKVSLYDIREAYRGFGLDMQSIFHDDETIIGTFQSRVGDSPLQEPDLRRALNIIGQHRMSRSIQHVASNRVTTYEQALAWLGATDDMVDDFLVSMFGVKVHENPANEELARHCMKMIAEKRKSSALEAWLETGQLGEMEMDFGQAYTRLGIGDRTVEDDLVITSYNLLAQETPSQIKELRRALAAIAKSRKSFYLQSFLDSNTTEHKLSEWPVGLENIGNTCYLNSLLQFYFTVKPLRDLVLNFDDYKMDLSDAAFERKQVGSRKVSRKEVERAQRFVYELQRLFQSMITVPDDKVTPEQELARLTLISSSAEETIRRKSILNAQRPALGGIDGQLALAPLAASTNTVETEVAMANNSSSTTNDENAAGNPSNEEASSEGTLVDTAAPEANLNADLMVMDSVEKEQQQARVFEDKENFAPTKADIPRPSTPECPLMPLGETSPSRANEQSHPRSPKNIRDATSDSHMNGQDVATLLSPPSRPPPIPPRQKPEENKRAIQQEVELGAQQDVTEVIANVLFQLQCAIKPQTFDESGEQIDQIKQLFFGKQKSYTTNDRGDTRFNEEFISDIKVDVASGPRDIYAALDGAFDVQEVEVAGSLEPQYATISQLPPVLQILVQRAQFDPEKKSTFKSIHHLELKETIYMDRYMDSQDQDLAQRRQTCWAWKKDLARLQGRKIQLTRTEVDLDMPEVLSSTIEYLKQCLHGEVDDAIEVEAELLASLEKASAEAAAELSGMDQAIKTLSTNINSQFADMRSMPYRLHSVFIHRGMVNSGHYWIYIYDFANSMWRKYNDGYVTEVTSPATIFEAEQSTRPATPYFLVYVRDDLRSELVESVCRDVVDVQPSQEDTIMVDDDRGTENLLHWTQELTSFAGVKQVDYPCDSDGQAALPGFW